MATKANIKINDKFFHVTHDGGNADDIMAAVIEAVSVARRWGVKDEFIPEATLAVLYQQGADDALNLLPGSFDYAQYEYKATISEGGGVGFEVTKGV